MDSANKEWSFFTHRFPPISINSFLVSFLRKNRKRRRKESIAWRRRVNGRSFSEGGGFREPSREEARRLGFFRLQIRRRCRLIRQSRQRLQARQIMYDFTIILSLRRLIFFFILFFMFISCGSWFLVISCFRS